MLPNSGVVQLRLFDFIDYFGTTSGEDQASERRTSGRDGSSPFLHGVAVLLGLAVLVVTGTGVGAEDGSDHVVAVFRGQNGPSMAHAQAATTNDDWTDLWARVEQTPPRLLKENEETGIAIFAGERPTGGYRLEVRDVSPTPDRLDVRMALLPPGSIAAQVITAPYIFIIVDKVAAETYVALDDSEAEQSGEPVRLR